MLSDFIDSDIIHSDRRPQQNNGQRIYSFTLKTYPKSRDFLHKVLNIPPNYFYNKIFCKVDTYVVLCIESKSGP